MKQNEALEQITEQAKQNIVNEGMIQTRSSYQTAIQVIRPRNLQDVERRCLIEAAMAGDSYYYSWKQGGEIIEGLSVGAALSMVRNFGNCAIECKVVEQPLCYVFEGVFIDLETGFNLIRPFRQNKTSPKKKDGGDVYKGERGTDIIFQIGTSKAMRNAVLNALPKFLADKVFAEAKKNVRSKIETMGIEKAKLMILKKAAALGISQERVEEQYGKEKAWDIEGVIQITSALRAVEDGLEKDIELFPLLEGEQSTKSVSQPKAEETASLLTQPEQTPPATSDTQEMPVKPPIQPANSDNPGKLILIEQLETELDQEVKKEGASKATLDNWWTLNEEKIKTQLNQKERNSIRTSWVLAKKDLK
jgi:hypothetical protein